MRMVFGIAAVFVLMASVASAGPLLDRAVAEGFGVVDGSYVAGSIAYGGGSTQTATVIDVRPAPSYATGHIPGAVNLPDDAALSSFLRTAPRNAEYIIGCGAESGHVLDTARTLRNAGFDNVNVFFKGPVWRANHYLVIPPDYARRMHGRDGVVFVDTRHDPEATIAGAVSPDTISAAPDDTVIVFCGYAGCTGAPEAAQNLVLHGFQRVRVLDGGFTVWQESRDETIKAIDGFPRPSL